MSAMDVALHELLGLLALDGVRIQRRGYRIRIGPRSKITPAIRARVENMKPFLLEYLHDESSDGMNEGCPAEVPKGVSSVMSVSEPTVQWDRDELIAMGRAGIAVDEIPLAAEIKQHFTDLGARVVAARRSGPRVCGARHRAALLIRAARRQGSARAIELRDAWRERLAICSIDGGLPTHEAEQIALIELLEISKGSDLR